LPSVATPARVSGADMKSTELNFAYYFITDETNLIFLFYLNGLVMLLHFAVFCD